MNGIENIIKQIENDTRAEIARIEQQAQQKAEEISSDYQRRAAEIISSKTEAAEKKCAEILRIKSSAAALEASKSVLAAKQEIIDNAFSAAFDRLCAMPREEYINLLSKLIVSAVPSGCGRLVFSKNDADIAERVTNQANADGNGKFTLSAESANIARGVIIVNDEFEISLDFEKMIELLKPQIKGEVAEILFGKASA